MNRHTCRECSNIMLSQCEIEQCNQCNSNKLVIEFDFDKVVPYNYRAERCREYPSIGDQLDDLYKQGVFSKEIADKIKAIKDKYPKE